MLELSSQTLIINQSDTPAVMRAERANEQKADDAGTEFEAYLIYTMIKSMRSSLSDDTLAGSKQQDMYQEMMDREVAHSIAERGELGIKSMLANQLTSASARATLKSESMAPLIESRADFQNLDAQELVARQRIYKE